MQAFGCNLTLLFTFLVTINSQQPLRFLDRFLPEDAFKAVPFTFPPSTDVTELPTITDTLPTQNPGSSTPNIPQQNGDVAQDIFLQGDDCSVVLDIRREGQSTFRFALGPSNGSHCVLILQGASRLALQVSGVTLAPGVFQCELEGIAVYSLADGRLFFMDQFCGSRPVSPLLLTDNASAVLTVRYGGVNNSSSFELNVFTYEPYRANLVKRPNYFYG